MTLPVPPEVAAARPDARVGKFIRTQKLGAGGMGEVWKAWDTELARWVALKLLKSRDDDEMARFLREAQLAGKLTHPNIAAVYEVNARSDTPYIAMQFVDGVTLRALPRGDRRTVARVIRDAALALEAAHAQGIVHRDVKPENIMVTTAAEPRVYVMDFGLARTVDGAARVSVSGALLGTPAYMSPEQTRGGRVDVRTDVWSLGATLYELVTRRPPFDQKTVLETLRLIQDTEPAAPRAIDAAIDADLETIVLKCLEKDPDRRYRTAGGLADDLSRWLAGEPIIAHPPSLGYRLRKRLAKRRAVVLALAGGLAAVAVTLALVVPRWLAERARVRGEEAAKIEAQRLQATLQELNGLWLETATIREWTRQHFRRPEEIRDAVDANLARLTAFVNAHPNLPQGHYVRARARLMLGDLAAAEEDLRRATSVAPDFEPGWSALAQTLLERCKVTAYVPPGAISQPDASLLREAEEAFRRGASAAPSAVRWGLARSHDDEAAETITRAMQQAYVERGTNDALRTLREAHRRKPSEEYARWLGNLGPAEERAKWFEEALRIAPHHAWSLFDRAVLASEKGDHEGAERDLTHALAINPMLAGAYFNRGNVRRRRGNAAGAIEDYSRALELRPSFDDAALNRGLAKVDQGDPQGALADFTRAIELRDRACVRWQRANVHMNLNALDAAVQDYTRAIELEPQFADAYQNRGNAYQLLQRPDDAIEDFTRVLELKPGFAEAYVNRASARCQKGDLDAAIVDVTRALEIDSKRPEGYAIRALARQGKKDFARALADCERALQLAPPDWHMRATVEGWVRSLREK